MYVYGYLYSCVDEVKLSCDFCLTIKPFMFIEPYMYIGIFDNS